MNPYPYNSNDMVNYGWGYMESSNKESAKIGDNDSYYIGYKDGLDKEPIDCYCMAPGCNCCCGG